MKDDKFDFDTEFMSEDEINEMLDNLVILTGKQIAEEDNRTSIINPYKIQQLLYTYKMLKYSTKGTKAKVDYELHTPYKSMGFVSVIGANLSFKNTEWFLKAVEFASNFEAYPRTDGTIQMNFTFHGLTTPIE